MSATGLLRMIVSILMSTIACQARQPNAAADLDDTQNDDGSVAEAASPEPDAATTTSEYFELPLPPVYPFVSHSDYPDCVHPGVEENCSNGWCRIPAGCFIWGAPEWVPHRGAANEEQAPVQLSHDIEIMQYEATIDQWRALDFELLVYPVDRCLDGDCPVDRISWFLAAEYANALSRSHEPPLEPCYVLGGCETVSGSYHCETLGMNAETAYGCEGYRFPTRAERKYAARAGTITSYYSGEITVTEHEHDIAVGCLDLVDVNLEPIAWYCANSGDGVDIQSRSLQPVGLKLPNAWGLYDMLGNVYEWTHDVDQQRSPEMFATDPYGEIGRVDSFRTRMGGSYVSYPSLLRTSKGLGTGIGIGGSTTGFRLVRTLGPGTPPTLADVPASNPQAR